MKYLTFALLILGHACLLSGARGWRQMLAWEQDAYCIVFSRYSTCIYTLRVYIRRLFEP